MAWPSLSKTLSNWVYLNLGNVNFGPRDPDFVKGDSKEKLWGFLMEDILQIHYKFSPSASSLNLFAMVPMYLVAGSIKGVKLVDGHFFVPQDQVSKLVLA